MWSNLSFAMVNYFIGGPQLSIMIVIANHARNNDFSL